MPADDRNELNMVFQFEHVDDGSGKDYGKWTTAKYDFKEFKKHHDQMAGRASGQSMEQPVSWKP